ncbi:MAG: hypothetical protein QOJ54_3481, partial [Aliidongia sp.]|nr:hypothetical protein [Aliidongia sp.]
MQSIAAKRAQDIVRGQRRVAQIAATNVDRGERHTARQPASKRHGAAAH